MVVALYECECGALVPWDSPTIRYVGDGTKQHQCRPDVPQAGHCGQAKEVSPAEVVQRIEDLEAQLAEQRERAEKAERERDTFDGNALKQIGEGATKLLEMQEASQQLQAKLRAAEESLAQKEREIDGMAEDYQAEARRAHEAEESLREANERCARLRLRLDYVSDLLEDDGLWGDTLHEQRRRLFNVLMGDEDAALEAAEAAAPAEGE